MPENLDKNQLLTDLLAEAADEKPGAAEKFFHTLLQSSVFIPLKPQSVIVNGDGPNQPQRPNFLNSENAHGFAVLDYEGQECLPIFSEMAFLNNWLGPEAAAIEKEFKTLLWLIGNETSLYLNPGEEVGKEITTWEISLLRRGEETVPELVAALSEHPLGQIEVRSEENLFPQFAEKLLPILQVYPELELAFLVGIREGENAVEKPMLGLVWAKKTSPGKKAYIRSEIEHLAEELDDVLNVTVVDDLDQSSQYREFFSGAQPIYSNVKPQKQGFLRRVKNWLRGLLQNRE